MKICFWVTSVIKLGGVQQVTRAIAGALAKKHDVVVVTEDRIADVVAFDPKFSRKVTLIRKPYSFHRPRMGNIYRWGRILNNKTGLLNHQVFSPLMKLLYFPPAQPLITFFNEQNFDWIIGVEGWRSVLLAWLAPHLQAKTAGWQHGRCQNYFYLPRQYYFQRRSLFQRYLKQLDTYVVLASDDVKITENNFHCRVQQIVNPRTFVSPIKVHYGRNLLAAGRLEPVKGYERLLYSLAYLNHLNPEWQCEIAGTGSQAKTLTTLCQQLDLATQVHFLGRVTEMPTVFARSSVFLLTSYWEGMPLVILEALEMGCPVVTFDIPAINDLVVDGYNGIVVPQSAGSQGFAQAIAWLLEDQQLWEKLHHNALQEATKYSLDKIISKWESLLQVESE